MRQPFPELLPGYIHLWIAQTVDPFSDAVSNSVQSTWHVLSDEERERARRYAFEIHRRRFVIRRGLLRKFLGSYLKLAPDGVNFVANPYGKLALAEAQGMVFRAAGGLHFNLSHSAEVPSKAGVALFAFALGQEIGVDVEWMRPDLDFEALARRYFSAAEQKELFALPEEQHLLAFFNCWTRKEAYIKAQGQGLSLPLDEFDVSLTPGEPPRLLAVRHAVAAAPASANGEDWTMIHLESDSPVEANGPACHCLPNGYVGALAIRGHDWQIQTFEG
jgi:4'-phosphopantetheinyl transferase